MKWVLLRHGNTFAPGDKVVMVGATQDLPLVARGEQQAAECAEVLAEAGPTLSVALAAPLARTRRSAELLTARLSLPPARLEERLREVDYGRWTGLTDAEIAERHGSEPLRAWREDGVWPEAFVSRPEAVGRNLRALLDELGSSVGDGGVLAVTSAGILRCFLALDPVAFAERKAARALGFRTGHLGLLETSPDATVRILLWDVSPAQWPAQWAAAVSRQQMR